MCSWWFPSSATFHGKVHSGIALPDKQSNYDTAGMFYTLDQKVK